MDIGEIVYFLIIIVVLIISALKQLKKQQPPKKGPAGESGGQDEKDIFEQLFGSEERRPKRPGEEEPGYFSERKMKAPHELVKVKEEESITNKYERQVKEKEQEQSMQKKKKTAESLLRSDEEEESYSVDFDLRKAVIYSEILNRHHF